jgi:hypothetical protein
MFLSHFLILFFVVFQGLAGVDTVAEQITIFGNQLQQVLELVEHKQP